MSGSMKMICPLEWCIRAWRVIGMVLLVGMAALGSGEARACAGATVSGPSTVNESDTNVLYTYNCFSGSVTGSITWVITNGANFVTLVPGGTSARITPKAISGNATINIRAYDASGINFAGNKNVTINNNIKTLDAVSFISNIVYNSGSKRYINKGSYQQTLVAYYDDGTSQNITSAAGLSWSENSATASISMAGVLNTSGISANHTITVTGTYTHNPGFAHLIQTKSRSWPLFARAKLPKIPIETVFSGPASVNENTATAGTVALGLVWDDNSQDPLVPVVWSDNSPFMSINANGVISTLPVTSQQSVTPTGQFDIATTFPDYPDYAGQRTAAPALPITILNNEKVLAGLAINVLSTVDENSATIVTTSAIFDDSSTALVTPLWSDDSPYADIDSNGVLTTSSVLSDQSFTLTASYTYRGVTMTATKAMLVKNSQRVLTGLSISGPASVNENDTAAYTVTAIFDDNTTQVLPGPLGGTLVWNDSALEATIDANGVLTTTTVTSDQYMTVSASYSFEGASALASLPVVLLNNERLLTGLGISGVDTLNEGGSAQYTAIAYYDDGAETVTPVWTVSGENGAAINFASINTAGLLSSAAVTTNEELIVGASYSNNNVTVTSDKRVVILIQDIGNDVMVRASVDSHGVQSNGPSAKNAISADGRFVVYASDATNLVAGDSNGFRDIFVHDRQTGTTERVSIDSAGSESNGTSDTPAISADGRFVVFASVATNLVAGDSNGARDIFVHDRRNATTARVSIGSTGAQGNGDSVFPAISANGQHVAFASDASNLVGGDSNGLRDIFVHDRQSGTTARVSIDSAGLQSNGASDTPAISANGQFVVLVSDASNLVAGDSNGLRDIFVHDRQNGSTARVSIDSAGLQGNGASNSPAISADAQFVAFASDASNLIAGDNNGLRDIFVHNRQSGATTRVSIDSTGFEGNGASNVPAINADGQFVVFTSAASNLVVGDGNGLRDIFVHELRTGNTTRINLDANNIEGNLGSNWPAMSGDARLVSFASSSSNIIAGDTNNTDDVFVRLRAANLKKSDVWLAPVSGSSSLGGQVSVEVHMDFSDDPTLGGGIDIAYDSSILAFSGFSANPGLGGDVSFERVPDNLSIELNGMGFGNFVGIAGPKLIGTLFFNALGLGTTNLVITDNDAPFGGFYSAITLKPQAINYTGTTINISNNNAPVAASGGPYNTMMDTPVNGTLSASDADGDPLTYSLVSNGTLGMAVITDANTGAFTYTPNAGVTGADSFTFVANDGMADSNIATVTVTISAGGGAVTIIDNTSASITYAGANWGHGYQAGAGQGGTISYTDGVTERASLTFSGTGIRFFSKRGSGAGIYEIYLDGSLVSTWDGYAPSAQFQVLAYEDNNLAPGTHTIEIRNTSTRNASSNGYWMHIDWFEVSNGGGTLAPPVASDAGIATMMDTPVNGTLSASDADGDPLTYSLVSNGTLGMAVITDANTGAFTYTPNAGVTGTDSFTFVANDGMADSNIATVTVTIMSGVSNLLVNPGFETGDVSGWYGGGSARFGNPHSGVYALRIWGNAGRPARYQSFPVTGGNSYTFRGWINVTAITTDAFYFEVRWYGAGGPEIVGTRVIFGRVTSVSAYTEKSAVDLVAPAGAVSARLYLQAGNNGTVWYDDLSVVDTTGGGTP